MNLWICWLLGWLAAAVGMACAWSVQKRTGRADWVDVWWTGSTGGLAVAFVAVADGGLPRRLLIAALATAWAIRLAAHLSARIRSSAEDRRYLRLRRRLGESTDAWLFVFFQFQGFLCVFFATPALLAARNTSPLGLLDAAGVLVWVAAVAGESVSDFQLRRFRKARPEHKALCREGLWKYSRHPNYFFEWMHWWSYVAIGWHAPHGWLTLAGPALMLVLILKVTGIPPAEASSLDRLGEVYRQYQRTVSPFVPWPPRRGA